MLVLAPWTVRNFVVLDKFVPVTTGGGKALFVATYLPGDGRQLRVKRELIRRFEGKQEVTDREVADTQMKDLLDKVARKYPDLERDAALAKIGRENFRKYVREEPVQYARDGRDEDVERVAARLRARRCAPPGGSRSTTRSWRWRSWAWQCSRGGGAGRCS